LGIWLLCAQVLAHRSSTSSLQVYIQHWDVVSPIVLHLHFQSHPLILAFRILIPGSAVPTSPFASSVLLPGSILTHMSCPIHSTFWHFFDTHVVLHYPLGMGVLIVFHHVVNQPHTPSPHFASFPTWTPRLSLYGSILVYLHLRSLMNPPFHPQSIFPSANLSSFHLPHTETHQWDPHPSSFFQENSTLPGACISHWSTRFCICTFLPKKLFIIYCTNAFFSRHYIFFCCHRWRLASFWPHATHVTLGWSFPYHLPLPASSISSEYSIGNLPLPSEFVHLVPPLAQLITGLVIPLTLNLVTWLRPLFISYILQPRAVLSLPTS
jgi:hypothetical protein